MSLRGRELLASLAAAVAITAALVLQPAGLLSAYDIARMHVCYRHDLRTAVLAGDWPWWNPHTALGRPFFADIETATLYPPNWLSVLVGVDAGIVLLTGLHVLLLIEGFRRLAGALGADRSTAVLAALTVALAGGLLARIQAGQLTVFCVIALLPWLWRAVLAFQDAPSGRALASAGGWAAAAVLAGSPPVLWCGLVPLAAMVAARSTNARQLLRGAAGLIAAGALGAGIAAVQLWPFAVLVRHGNRPLDDSAFGSQFGAGADSGLSLLLPVGSWLPVNWEYNLNVGPLVLAFAAWAVIRRARAAEVRGLAAAALAAGLLAVGDRTPLLPALADWVPGFAGLRYPSRYGIGLVLVLGLLAAVGASRWRETQAGRGPLLRSLWIAHLALLVIGIYTQGAVYRAPEVPRHEAHIRADLRAHGLPVDGAPVRAALPRSLLRANAGAMAEVSTLSGFNNPGLDRTWTTLHLLAGVPEPSFHRAEVDDEVIARLAPFHGLFGVGVSAPLPEKHVRFGPPAGPRVFVADRVAVVPSWRDAVARIRAGHDPVAVPLVEEPLALSGGGEARIASFARNRVEVECRSTGTALLVLAEAWHPGWTAAINGEPQPIVPANAWMRAVVIPPGAHRVVFTYLPAGLLAGAAVSAFSLAIAVWLARRRPVMRPDGLSGT